jgi:hypothetical protein
MPGGLEAYRTEELLTRDTIEATYRFVADNGTLSLQCPASGQSGVGC